MPVEHAKVKEVFAAAIELSGDDRRRFLDDTCSGDAELRREVEEYLFAAERTGALLGDETRTLGLDSPILERPGGRVGRYKLLQQIGEGGFGIVFMAEQEQPVRRRVALKIIKLGMDTRQVIARFEAERQALALMDHPNIAKVLDGGSTETGRPYFVMELVQGVPITEFCDQRRFSIEQRLKLFLQVCQAVQHAHQKGLVHRDLKPSNILVSERDDQPFAKVIDFGIAKATRTPLTDKTLFTELNHMIGTPEYMSPEQANGAIDVDTRSDVYSLGVVLYELLTGFPPFEARDLRSKAFAEMQRIIREVDPPRPSAKLSSIGTVASVAAQRGIEPARLRTLVRGELDWIVMKAMEKDRTRRYETASALAADVMHHLADEPVTAAAPSKVYRFRKFARRNRGALAAVTIVFAVLCAGVIGTSIGLVRESRQRTIAERERGIAEQQAAEAKRQAAIATAIGEFQSGMLDSADPNRLLGDKVTVLQVTSAAVEELNGGKLASQPILEAEVRAIIGRTLLRLGRYDLAEPCFRKALELRRAFAPTDEPAIADGFNSLGAVLTDQGKLAEAELHYRTALEMRQRSLPAGHQHVGEALNNLGDLLCRQGNYVESEKLNRLALEIYRNTLPADDPGIVPTLQNLATSLDELGRTDEAVPFSLEAQAIARKSLPPGHPTIASSLDGTAKLYRKQGKLVEAEGMFREALAIRRKSLPAGHQRLATSLSNLAIVCEEVGKMDEAEALQREALAIRRAAFPTGHPDLATGLSNLALFLYRQGNVAEAEAMLREAMEMNRKTRGTRHPDTARMLLNLGGVLWSQRKTAEAEAAFREALSIAEGALPPGHPTIVRCTVMLAQAMQARKDFAGAESLLRAAVEVQEKRDGKKARATTQLAGRLADVLDEASRQQEAAAVRLEYGVGAATSAPSSK